MLQKYINKLRIYQSGEYFITYMSLKLSYGNS